MSLLPHVNFSQIVGVLEIADDFQGRVNVGRVASQYGLDLDELLPSVEACELLGFLKVNEGEIELLPAGKTVLKASLRQRKGLLREAALRTPIFQDVIGKLQKSGGRMHRDDLAQILGFKLWTHDEERAFKTVVNWGRHAGILTYDADSKTVLLLHAQPSSPRKS